VSTTRPGLRDGRDETRDPTRPTTPQLVAIAAGLAAGLAVWLVGLPDRPVWDTTWKDLTVPVAVLVSAGAVVVVTAATQRRRWRVVDLTVAAVLAVAGGLLLWGMNAAYAPVTAPLSRVWPPLPALVSGVWLVPGVLVGLVVRRPGAALLGETVAALIEAQLGGLWGFASLYYGVIEGLGAEVVLALLLYRRFGLGAALATGAGAALALVALDLTFYYPEFPADQKLAYLVISVLSGAVVAGGGSWLLTRALAATGALAPLASGRSAERV
jgi:energy-coupling factor transport system substrate-specific component